MDTRRHFSSTSSALSAGFTSLILRIAYCSIILCVISLSGPLQAQNIAVVPEQPDLQFEVASIRPEQDTGVVKNWQLRFQGDSFEATGETASALMKFAYGIGDQQLSGGPGWLNVTCYTIKAKIDPSVTTRLSLLSDQQQTDAHRRILRTLLESRFHLVTHYESKLLPAYVLTIDKSGTKLKEVTPEESVNAGPALNLKGRGSIRSNGIKMWLLTDLLSSELNATVVDKTSLQGTYKFALQWDSQSPGALGLIMHGSPRNHPSGDDATQAAGADIGRPPSPDPPLDPPLAVALKEQLGLDLLRKPVSMEVVHVDRIERPSAN